MMERIGKVLFRFRGVTPVPLLLLFVVAAKPSWLWIALSLPFLAAGEFLRTWSVGYSGLGTRGRTIGAEELSAWGPYARLRNPIYAGNFLLCLGFAIAAGLAAPTWRGSVTALFVAFFAFQYAAIVAAEERFLSEKFGERFEEYRRTVPRWFPKLGAVAAPPRSPRWREALRSERDTMLGLGAIAAYLVAGLTFGFLPLL